MSSNWNVLVVSDGEKMYIIKFVHLSVKFKKMWDLSTSGCTNGYTGPKFSYMHSFLRVSHVHKFAPEVGTHDETV